MPKRTNTATNGDRARSGAYEINGLGLCGRVVTNNRVPESRVFSGAEIVALGAMLDRLDALESAVRVRPNAKAVALLREAINIDLEIGDTETRIAAHAAAVLLEMLDKVAAAPPALATTVTPKGRG